jgi:starvation-inducible DNA-binding protein
MASTMHANHLPSLEAHQRQEVGSQLQTTLVELIDLSLIGKQMHWTVVGPTFRSLHLQLDEMVDSWRALADTVAERAVAIGIPPDGQSATVATTTDFPPVVRGEMADRVVVRELTYRLADVAERVRGRIDGLGELDAASQDVAIEVVRALEEQLWMVRAQLPDAGGQ